MLFELIAFALVLTAGNLVAAMVLNAWMFKKLTDKELVKDVVKMYSEVSLETIEEFSKKEEP